MMKKVNHLQLKILQFLKHPQGSNPLMVSFKPLQHRVRIRVQTQCLEGPLPRFQLGYYRSRPFEHEWPCLVVVLERPQAGAEIYQAREPLPEFEMRNARGALRQKPFKIFDHLGREDAQRRQVDKW